MTPLRERKGNAMARRTRRDFGKLTKKGKRYYCEYTGPDGKRHTPGQTHFLTLNPHSDTN